MAIIHKLEPLLPWRGKVDLKSPQNTFVVFVETPIASGADGIHPSGKPADAQQRRFSFGRLLAEGRRDLVGKLDLKKRNYIGTTSLDAELSLLMANLARVREHDLVYDPYCGTAGTLVAAGAFGARVLGCDLHLPALRGELRTRSGPSKLKQAKVQGIPETFAQYGLPPPVDRLHGDSGKHLAFVRNPTSNAHGLFDAIITDPPYGIREKPAEVDDERLLARTLPPEQMQDHVARTALAALEQILSDVFALAARTLAPSGRLVFLLPTTEPFSANLLPAHPGLVLEGACEQLMAARWSRWCVVMRRVASEESTIAPSHPVVIHSASGAPVESPEGGNARGDGRDAKAGGIFNRASLRPDDLSNVADLGSAAAAAGKVLHPQLLGKSAGARRRLEKRLAQAATNAAAEDTDAGVNESGRSSRRRARNQGRGTYEDRVRNQLVAACSGEGGRGWAGTYSETIHTISAFAVVAVSLTSLAIAVGRRA